MNIYSLMSSGKLEITILADEWKSSKGGLSTMNREMAIELAKHPDVAVTLFVPKCTEEDKKAAGKHNIRIVEAEKRVGFDEPLDWLSFPPKDLVTDVIIGHGVKLGKQAQVIKDYLADCSCWLQVVHTAPEELAMFKNYPGAISKGDEKQWTEVRLCAIADIVVAVGPKLQEFYLANLSSYGKNVINLTPGIFDEFSDLKLSPQWAKKFRVLVFGRGDSEDFELKGFDIAAKAVAELNDKSYQLIFVGAPSGNEEQVTKKLLKQGLHRSQLKVKGFVENREDLARLLSAANLAVIPSRTEGFGLTALEALSAGLPFLVCQNSGFGEALQEISDGSSWIVDSEDPKKWAEAIKGMRKKGRESALKECQELRTLYAAKYSWEKQCNDLVKTMSTFVTATRRRHFLRATSWRCRGGINREKPEPGQDGKTCIKRSVSQEPSRKLSKERKSKGKQLLINFFFKPKYRKKSFDLSSNEENDATFESTSVATSDTAGSMYRGAAPQSCENVSPLIVPEVQRSSLTDSLSSTESVGSPISLGYESGFMSAEADYNQELQENCFGSAGGDLNDPSVSSGKTISFFHCFDSEGKAFKEEVLKLYDRFGRCLGYKCHLDKAETIQVAENKFRYVLNNVQNRDFVFICVSPELKRIFDSSLEEIQNSTGFEGDDQCRLRLASDMMLGEIAVAASNKKGKFMPIILKGSSTNDVPSFMNSYLKYHWPKDELTIRCVIEEKPEIVPACVGNVKTDLPSLVVKPTKLN